MRSWRLPFVVMVVLVPLIGGAPASASLKGGSPASCEKRPAPEFQE